jgi:hypothetical protein
MHLRPRNSQVFQFLRMARNMVSDLKYDSEGHDDVQPNSAKLSASGRAFLGCYYLSSSSVTSSFY